MHWAREIRWGGVAGFPLFVQIPVNTLGCPNDTVQMEVPGQILTFGMIIGVRTQFARLIGVQGGVIGSGLMTEVLHDVDFG